MIIFATIIGFECLRIFSFSFFVCFVLIDCSGKGTSCGSHRVTSSSQYWFMKSFSWRAWCGYCASRDMKCLCVMQKVGRLLCKSISIHNLKNEICFHILERLLLVLLPHTVFIKQYWMFSFWNVLDCSLGTLSKGWQPGKQTKDCSDVSLNLFSSTVWSWDEPYWTAVFLPAHKPAGALHPLLRKNSL